MEIDHETAGFQRACVANADGLHTIAQSTLTTRVGKVDEPTLLQVCAAVAYALGC